MCLSTDKIREYVVKGIYYYTCTKISTTVKNKKKILGNIRGRIMKLNNTIMQSESG